MDEDKRRKVLELCGHLCFYCHKKAFMLEVVHKISTKLGGTESHDNLVTICRECIDDKSVSPVSFDDFRLKLMQERSVRPRCDYIQWNSWEKARRCPKFVGSKSFAAHFKDKLLREIHFRPE